MQLLLQVTELITSETRGTNKSDFKQKKNILPNVASRNVGFLRKYDKIW